MDYVSILKTALAAPFTAEPSCCGRVYVSVDKEHARGIKAAAKKLGRTFQTSGHYGTRNVLYVGYDNADGKALGQGTAIVASLKAAGIGCYRDEHGD